MRALPNIVAAMSDRRMFGPYFAGASWDGWRAVLRGAFALPMTPSDIEFFRSVTSREPPARRVKELNIVAGRRSGKDSVVSFIGANAAATFRPNGRTRPGERPVVLLLGADRSQARGLLGYVKGYFAEIPALMALVTRETQDGLELSTGVDIIVATSDFRLVRGRTVLLAVLNETAFWPQEGSSSPDVETFRAITPALATLGDDAMVIMISSAHRRSGLLYARWEKFYGVDNPDTLVVHAKTRQLNPTISQAIIDAAMADDPQSAAAEYESVWRDDLAGYITRPEIEATVDRGVTVRPPVPGVRYTAFIDASSGKSDSFTAGIASRDGDTGILHAAIEIPAPCDPVSALATIAATLKTYGITEVWGDRYATGFVESELRRHGITLQHSARTRSDLYHELLPALRSRRVRLLDNERAITQFAALERRALPGGGERIDHPAHAGAKDDVANAIAGALVMATADSEPHILTFYQRQSEASATAASPPTLLQVHAGQPIMQNWMRRLSDGFVKVNIPVPCSHMQVGGVSYLTEMEGDQCICWMAPRDALDLLGSTSPSTLPFVEANRPLLEKLKERAAAENYTPRSKQNSIRVSDLLQAEADARPKTLAEEVANFASMKGAYVNETLRMIGRAPR